MVYIRVKDVEQLIDDNIGNTDVLKQVQRAMQLGEVISEKEHAYVQRLMGTRRAHKTVKPSPEVAGIQEAAERHQEMVKAVAPSQKGQLGRIPGLKRLTRSSSEEKSGRRVRLSRKKIIVFVIVVVLIVGAAYASTLRTQGSGAQTPVVEAPLAGFVLPAEVMLGTDQATYSSGDIILVSGKSSPGAQVALEISSGGSVLWQDSITTDSDGTYSTITIAGGAGWVGGAAYSVTATDAAKTHSAEFSFRT